MICCCWVLSMAAVSTNLRSPFRDVLKSALSTIPSLFGRLAFLAAHRNPASGSYEDQAAIVVFGPEVNQVLRHAHMEAFEAWLYLNLEQQTTDLSNYLETLVIDPREILRQWSKESSYMKLIPPDAEQPQVVLFHSDLELVLTILNARQK
jgi:hypothetical protein